MVELMVSVAVLSLLIVSLAGVFQQVSRAWIAGEGGVERRRSSRALTDFIRDEMRSAVVPVEQAATTGKTNLQFLINPPDELVPREKFGNADTVFWQAPVATETSFGELAEVGYFVRWSETGPRRPTLCRFLVNPSRPANEQPGAAVVPNDRFLIYKNPRWLSEVLINDVAPAARPAYRGLFAENVVGFWVRAYQPDGQELLTNGKRQFDSRVGYKFTNSKNVVQDHFLPSKVNVSMAQLDTRTATALDTTWEEVRSLSRDPEVKDAGDFLAKLQTEARNDKALARLLPGLRIYSTEVQLENAR
jgi:uncharacterized protein (TIGR02599 family)